MTTKTPKQIEEQVKQHHAYKPLIDEMKDLGTYVPVKPKVNTSVKHRKR